MGSSLRPGAAPRRRPMNARPTFPSTRAALGLPLAAFSLLLGATFALFGGCAFPTQGLSNPDGGGGSRPCSQVADCDDDNPCTTDKCGADGNCEWTAVADGKPAHTQTAGDCKTIRCENG